MSLQATVFRFDSQERRGSVLMDNGRELRFEAPALASSGLRFLRPGQRVDVELDAQGDLERVWLAGIGPGQIIR